MSISRCFAKAASSAGSTSKERFGQGKLLKGQQSAEIRKGICGGLSLTFLGLYSKSGFRSLTDANNHSWGALLEFSLKLQNQVMEVGGGATSVVQQMMVNFCAAAPVVGLRGSGMVKSYSWPCAGDIARHVLSSPGFYIIALPNHYVAAASDGNNSAVFYDPNAGAAEFTHSASFSAMLTFFFTTAEVSEAYNCSGNQVHVLRFEAA